MTDLRVLTPGDTSEDEAQAGDRVDLELEKKLEKGMWFLWEKGREPIFMWVQKNDVVGKILFCGEWDEYYGGGLELDICTSRQIEVLKEGDVYRICRDFPTEEGTPRPEEVMRLEEIYKDHPVFWFYRETEYGMPVFAISVDEDDLTGKESELTKELKEMDELDGINRFDKRRLYKINIMAPYYEMFQEELRKHGGEYEELKNSLPKGIFCRYHKPFWVRNRI